MWVSFRNIMVSLVLLYGLPALAQAAQPPPGSCGSANGVPSSTKPTTGLCSAGTPSAVTQSGTNWIWTCKGRGTAVNCSAPVQAAPPALTLTVTPPNPSIPQTAPLGSFVAKVTAAWSNGAPFTGTIQFVAPNFDDGGTFALSGSDLIVSPVGMGVNGDGGTVQHVTVQASQ
jgi:hypothetical protein